jgi:hypothetical protein
MFSEEKIFFLDIGESEDEFDEIDFLLGIGEERMKKKKKKKVDEDIKEEKEIQEKDIEIEEAIEEGVEHEEDESYLPIENEDLENITEEEMNSEFIVGATKITTQQHS